MIHIKKSFIKKQILCFHQQCIRAPVVPSQHWLFFCHSNRYAVTSHWGFDFHSRVCVCDLVTKSCLTLVTPWTATCQPPLFMGFFRQEYWSGLPFPFPGDLPIPGMEPGSPVSQADSLPTELRGKPFIPIEPVFFNTRLSFLAERSLMFLVFRALSGWVW